jgi:hypothetical protein
LLDSLTSATNSVTGEPITLPSRLHRLTVRWEVRVVARFVLRQCCSQIQRILKYPNSNCALVNVSVLRHYSVSHLGTRITAFSGQRICVNAVKKKD